jgi:hypothetical protein
MKNKKNILKHAVKDKSLPRITPSKTKVPDWFKNSYIFESGRVTPKRLPYSLKFKACSSFSDTFISGYMIPLSVDIAVEQSENGPIVSWNDPNTIFVALRNKEINKEIPTPEGFSDVHFVWNCPQVYKIPKGYSALVCHPLNRFDLPFLTLSGIVDGEVSLYGGNIPVFFNKNFEGIIEAGTPIAQIILFKTENWESEEDDSILEESEINERKSLNASFGWYKKNIWKQKKYS